MGRKSKKDRPPALILQFVAANVSHLRDEKYAKLDKVTNRNKALAKDAGTSLSQIQRITSGAQATGIDLIEWLAEVFKVRPHDLLTPYFYASKEKEDKDDKRVGESRLQRKAS